MEWRTFSFYGLLHQAYVSSFLQIFIIRTRLCIHWLTLVKCLRTTRLNEKPCKNRYYRQTLLLETNIINLSFDNCPELSSIIWGLVSAKMKIRPRFCIYRLHVIECLSEWADYITILWTFGWQISKLSTRFFRKPA